MGDILKEDIDFIVSQDIPWEEFNNCTVLISGANGFLPSYMVETFLHLNDYYKKNIKIIAIVRNHQRAENRFHHHLGRRDLNFIVQDVSLPIDVDEKIDYVIHAASQASPRYYSIDPVGTLNANILGTINLLEISKKITLKGFCSLALGGF